MSRLKPIQLAAAAMLALSFSAQAATPASGTITPDAPSLSFTGGPFVFPNVTTQSEVHPVTGGPVCQSTPGVELVCDTFALKLDVPDDYYTTNPTSLVKITMSWTATTTTEDYDFVLYDAAGNIVNEGEGTTNPEHMTFCTGQGAQDYKIVVIPWSAAGAAYSITVEMVDEPKARCKAPKSAEAAKSSRSMFGGAFGFGLLLPLIGFAALRNKRA